MLRSDQPHIFTIGHSDNSIERFIDLLRGCGITAIADVRSMPYSQFTPHFNRENLQASLKLAGISYTFLGDELGARRAEPECYLDGTARYDLIARSPRFLTGLRRITDGIKRYTIAMMCAEKDPVTCHRSILICRHLRFLGVPITHILEDGELETTADMERRLLKVTGVHGGDLFDSEQMAIERAYDIQGGRIAYTKDLVVAENRG